MDDGSEMLELCRLYNITDGKINFNDIDNMPEKHVQVFEYIRSLDYNEERKRIENKQNG